jgi:AraC family transcriptional regulator of adaptative response / DNA-3-methyladenine glycosylase II
MRAGRQPDAFPCGDLGLRRGAAACLGEPGAALSARKLEGLAERWRPWRAYAAMHLWSAYGELRAR